MERIGNANSQFLNIHTYIKNLNFGTIVHKYQKYLTRLLQEFPLLTLINTIVFFLSDNHDMVLYCIHLRQIVVIFTRIISIIIFNHIESNFGVYYELNSLNIHLIFIYLFHTIKLISKLIWVAGYSNSTGSKPELGRLGCHS